MTNSPAQPFAAASGAGSLTVTRQAVLSVIGEAAHAAEVAVDYLIGLWGNESGFGEHRVSPTGALGDFQFTRGTFADMVHNHGIVISGHLNAVGQSALAQTLHDFATGLQTKTIARSDRALQALRNDPFIGTYCSAFYTGDIARALNVDPHDRDNWGSLYAAYNIGVGNARKLSTTLAGVRDAGKALGSVAANNPMFFSHHETGLEALKLYRAVIEAHHEDFVRRAAAGTMPQLPTLSPTPPLPRPGPSGPAMV